MHLPIQSLCGTEIDHFCQKRKYEMDSMSQRLRFHVAATELKISANRIAVSGGSCKTRQIIGWLESESNDVASDSVECKRTEHRKQ